MTYTETLACTETGRELLMGPVVDFKGWRKDDLVLAAWDASVSEKRCLMWSGENQSLRVKAAPDRCRTGTLDYVDRHVDGQIVQSLQMTGWPLHGHL
ncbi:MAG: hypothetical protein VB858_05010, partial [Planctomycetaceae bacterium]